ncbi:Pentatricopeptide repeat-containing protein [Frankliniella fusca]|uniref:Pentatricopeptide repeat-containing protein n=1 Tax=Frankliniella fusca TaxID=407009 RepID=A0AAE1LDI2_9NEOP|nr:Pentatricopeptide repeat-containing protein [Frankliniella fusca]
MESLSVDCLAKCLEGHLSFKLIDTLRGNDINGVRFMSLTAPVLKAFDFNLADILDILGLIAEINAGSKDITASISNLNSSTSKTCVRSSSLTQVDTESMQTQRCEKNLNHSSNAANSEFDSNGSSSEECDPDMIAADAILRSFIKASHLEKLSDYELLNSQKACLNWKRLKDAGLPHASKPNLAFPNSAFIPVDKENSPPKKKSKPQESKRKSRRQLIKVSESDQNRGNLSSSGGASSSTGKRSQLIKPTKDKTDDVSDDEDANNSIQEAISPDNMYKLPDMDHFLTSEELSKIQPELPSFDVEDILLNNDYGKEYVPYLKDGFLVIDKVRKRLFRILVRHLCFKYVDHPTKVTTPMREGLAKSLLVKFPQYQKVVVVPHQSAWSHIVAHFKNIFKRILDKLPLAERPRKGKVEKKKKTTTPRCEIDVETLRCLNNSDANREEIIDGMKKTFHLRTADRKNGASITELIEKYPHLKHYYGEVLTLEFNLMHPKALDMVRVFTPLIQKVLDKIPSVKDIKPKCGLDEMKVFIHLCSKLPHCIDQDANPRPVEEEIIETLQAGKNQIEEFIDTKRSRSRSGVQPYLIAIQGNCSKTIMKYFLVLDSHPMELGNIPFLRAADWLFKAYNVFNVHYPLSWRNFFRFLQTCLYGVYLGTEDDVIPTGQNLYAKLLSL